MDSPTKGIVYRPHIRQPLSLLSTVVFTMMNGTTSDPVQCELRADAKELLWIGNASLFSWHPCSCTRNRVYRAMGWYWPILHCVPRQQGGGDVRVDLTGSRLLNDLVDPPSQQTDIVLITHAVPTVSWQLMKYLKTHDILWLDNERSDRKGFAVTEECRSLESVSVTALHNCGFKRDIKNNKKNRCRHYNRKCINNADRGLRLLKYVRRHVP